MTKLRVAFRNFAKSDMKNYKKEDNIAKYGKRGIFVAFGYTTGHMSLNPSMDTNHSKNITCL